MKTANRLTRSLLIAVLAMAGAADLPLARAQVVSGVTAAEPGQPKSLLITIIEGEGASNDIRTRTAREPIVQVDDENHKPVAGALVLFSLDKTGSSYANFGGASSLSVHTDAAGRAVASGFRITQQKGSYRISVHVTLGGLVADAVINESNVAEAAPGATTTAPAVVGGVSHKKLIWIVGGALAGGAVAGILIATQGSSPTTVSTGSGSVGAPAAVGGVRFQLHAPNR
jgi:hypothetical protein